VSVCGHTPRDAGAPRGDRRCSSSAATQSTCTHTHTLSAEGSLPARTALWSRSVVHLAQSTCTHLSCVNSAGQGTHHLVRFWHQNCQIASKTIIFHDTLSPAGRGAHRERTRSRCPCKTRHPAPPSAPVHQICDSHPCSQVRRVAQRVLGTYGI
jgi:hypothetical protein